MFSRFNLKKLLGMAAMNSRFLQELASEQKQHDDTNHKQFSEFGHPSSFDDPTVDPAGDPKLNASCKAIKEGTAVPLPEINL